MVISWIFIVIFFLLGALLTIFPGKIMAWWLKRRYKITGKAGTYNPAGDNIFHLSGPALFRIVGIMLLAGALYSAYNLWFS